jgi:hypothetical protein
MSTIKNKNVFIGICTRKERVISPGQLLGSPIFSFVCSRRSNFMWKTSDWVIQEIGLAKGLELHIILLIEEGVRSPGGLQGDVEYIPFNRASPSAAFSKILEMLSSLSSRAPAAITTPAETNPPAAIAEAEAQSRQDDWSTPRSDWSRGKFEIAFGSMIIRGEESRAEEINRTYLASDEAAHAITGKPGKQAANSRESCGERTAA